MMSRKGSMSRYEKPAQKIIPQDAEKGVQLSRGKLKLEEYSLGYVEGLNDARTMHGKLRVSA